MCCQLVAEFTLLVKFAAGSDFFVFFLSASSDRNLALDREASVSTLHADRYYLGKSLGNNIYAEKTSRRAKAGPPSYRQMERETWDVMELFKGSGLLSVF